MSTYWYKEKSKENSEFRLVFSQLILVQIWYIFLIEICYYHVVDSKKMEI